jgi:hypothetical protein
MLTAISTCNKYILLNRERSTLKIDPSNWIHLNLTSDDIVIATSPQYITQELLPTFKGYNPLHKTDPQFAIDYLRCKSSLSDEKRLARRLFNGTCMKRDLAATLIDIESWNPFYFSIITALFNQRIGIDLCRRIFRLHPEVIVVPDNVTFTLDLKLPCKGDVNTHPCIVGHAHIATYESNEKGFLKFPFRDKYEIFGHYNLDSGRVVYIIKPEYTS